MTEADQSNSNQTNGKTYQVKSAFAFDGIPPNPSVRIIFHGLQCFFFAGNRKCEIGIHNKTQGQQIPHPKPHDLIIGSWTKVLGTCLPILGSHIIGNSKNVGHLDIKVTDPDLLDGVYAYEREPFNRDDANDPRDWRWVIDFERDVYNAHLNKRTDAMTPSVTINNGLFYTFHRTASKFTLHPSDRVNDTSHDKPIGRVAQVIAANIYLKPGGKVELLAEKMPGLMPPFLGIPGVTHQIDITNDCRHDHPGCVFDPAANRKEDRNDFYLYYDTFDLPAGQPEYELIRTGESAADTIDELCDIEMQRHIVSTDEAPCGGTQFGQSAGPGL